MADQQVDVDKSVRDTVKDVNEAAHGNVHSATEKLHEDYVKLVNGGASKDQINQYWQGVQAAFKDSGMLNQIALDYARTDGNFNRLKDGNGNISEGSLSRDLENKKGLDALANDPKQLPENRFDLAMEQQLQAQMGDFSHRHFPAVWNTDNHMGKGDLDSRLQQMEYGNQTRFQGERDQQAARDGMAPLMQKGADGKTLFDYLDQMPGGRTDGKINQSDFKRYLETYDRMPADARTGLMSKDTHDYVQSLNDNWNYPKDNSQQSQDAYNTAQLLRGSHIDENNGTVPRNDRPYSLPTNYITKDTLAAATGYDKNDLENHGTQRVEPVAQQTPERVEQPNKPNDQAQPAHQLTPDVANKTMDTMFTLSDSAATRLFPDYKEHNLTVDSKMTQQTVADTLQNDNTLSKAQRDQLEALKSNWPAADGQPISMGDLAKAGGHTVKDQAGNDTIDQNWMKQHHQEMEQQAKGILDGVTANVPASVLGDGKSLSKDSLNEQIGKLNDQDPQKATLVAMRDNFNNISRDGTNITGDDLKNYASQYETQFKGFKGEARQNEVNAYADQKWQELGQGLKLGDDGKYVYDLARKSLEMQKANGLTDGNSPVNNDAIFKEVVRLMIVNQNDIPALNNPKTQQYLQELMKRDHISQKDIPAALNGVHLHQNFKLFTAEQEQDVKAKLAAQYDAQHPEQQS